MLRFVRFSRFARAVATKARPGQPGAQPQKFTPRSGQDDDDSGEGGGAGAPRDMNGPPIPLKPLAATAVGLVTLLIIYDKYQQHQQNADIERLALARGLSPDGGASSSSSRDAARSAPALSRPGDPSVVACGRVRVPVADVKIKSGSDTNTSEGEGSLSAAGPAPAKSRRRMSAMPAMDARVVSDACVSASTGSIALALTSGTVTVNGLAVPGITDAVSITPCKSSPTASGSPADDPITEGSFWVVRRSGAVDIISEPHSSSDGGGGPKVVRSIAPPAGSGGFTSAAVGKSHALLLARDGSVFALGSNASGQLGVHSPGEVTVTAGNGAAEGTAAAVASQPGIDRHSAPPIASCAEPTRVKLPGGVKARQIACGGDHSVVIDADGKVITFGSDSAMQLGHLHESAWNAGHCATPMYWSAKPNSVLGSPGAPGTTVIDVSCGDESTVILTNDGIVHAMGRGDSGQLGDGRLRHVSSGTVARPQGRAQQLPLLRSLSCGSGHCIGVGRDESIWGWGVGRDGQLSSGSRASRPNMTKIYEGEPGEEGLAKAKIARAGERSTVVVFDKD